MVIDDDGADMMAFSIDIGFRIKDMLCRFIDTNGDFAVSYHLFSLGYHIRRQGFQDLETCVSIAAQGTNSSSNSQSRHAGAWNHNAHPIFHQISGNKGFDRLYRFSQFFRRRSRCKSQGNRFRTSRSRFDILLHDFNHFIPHSTCFHYYHS